MKAEASTISLLVLGDANSAKVKIKFFRDAALVEKVLTVKDDDVGGFAAIFPFHKNVSMTEAAAGVGVDKDGLFLLLYKFLMEVEVIGL